MTVAPRVVVVHRRTEYDHMVGRLGTRQQVGFFLERRGRSLDEVERAHQLQREALQRVSAQIPIDWRRALVGRSDLDRWLFGPEDIVVAVGQDGLVANVAKYLDEQPVIGVDPDPATNPGVLVRHRPTSVAAVLDGLAERGGVAAIEPRTMVRAVSDDGREIRALNDLYVGHASHQSARYEIRGPDGAAELQSSSGVVVGTGTGSTGWCRSLALERASGLGLPGASDDHLAWFVREAWPSPTSGTDLVEGLIQPTETLRVEARRDGLVVFGDGMEHDRIELVWGQSVVIEADHRPLRLVV